MKEAHGDGVIDSGGLRPRVVDYGMEPVFRRFVNPLLIDDLSALGEILLLRFRV